MQKGGAVRFLLACILCLSVLIYNAYDITRNCFFTVEEKEFQTASKQEEPQEVEIISPTEPEIEVKEEQEQEAEDTSSALYTATGAVKGKIISNYISPYSAPASYNGVYMKDNTTAQVDIKTLLEGNLNIEIENNGEPQVLIMHTHTTESYMLSDSKYYTEEYTSRSTDNEKNMVAVGKRVAEILNNAGITTLHATSQHDYPQYNGSYTRSAATVNEYLKKYPTIKVVLDIHRDAVSSGSDKVKLVTEIEGKKAAQVMLVMGSQTGSVTSYPNWKENLKLALRLQQTIENKYPTLARPLSLVASRYNQNLTTGSLLLEFGTDANTLEEACYSAELVGNALAELLNKL